MLKYMIFLLAFLALMLSGCINKRGISATYYNDCSEYYDSKGYYHKDCDKNIIEFKDIKDALKTKEPLEEPKGNVW
jgi:hypothetical protein